MSQTASAKTIFDVCAIYGDRQVWEAYLNGFVEEAPEYLLKFASSLAQQAGVPFNHYCERLATSPRAAVELLLERGPGFNITEESYVENMLDQGIRHQILHGFPWLTNDKVNINQKIAEVAQRHSGLLSAWIGVSLREPDHSAKMIERAVKDWGMKGVTIAPFWENIAASDRSLSPIYRVIERLQLPLWVHAGQNFNSRASLDISDVRHIDRLAVAYPDIIFVIGHGGWPWIKEAVAILQRHKNVYLEFSSHRPKYMCRAGSGWEPLLFQGPLTLRDKVMFGSTAWVSTRTVGELASEIKLLPIPDLVMDKWLSHNATALFTSKEIQ